MTVTIKFHVEGEGLDRDTAAQFCLTAMSANIGAAAFIREVKAEAVPSLPAVVKPDLTVGKGGRG